MLNKKIAVLGAAALMSAAVSGLGFAQHTNTAARRETAPRRKPPVRRFVGSTPEIVAEKMARKAARRSA